jgi:hypothetical protein
VTRLDLGCHIIAVLVNVLLFWCPMDWSHHDKNLMYISVKSCTGRGGRHTITVAVKALLLLGM